eukprot:147459_1
MSLPVSMLSNTPLLSNAKSKPSNQDNILPIFHPFGAFKRIWDPILIIVLIISAIEIPFTLVFEINLTINSFAGIFAFSIDIFLCIDILITFRTGYFDKYDPLQLITSPKHIAIKYIKTRFLFDFVTSFPFEFVVATSNSNTNNLATYLQVFRVLRLIRLFKVARIIKMVRLFDNLPKRLSISPESILYIKIIKVFFGMILGAHYVACLWWETGKQMVQLGYDSWMEDVHGRNLYLISDTNFHIFLKYSYSYYFSIVTLFTTGYGDIVSQNIIECWISVIAIIVGTVYTSYLIGLATRFVREGDDKTQIEKKKK